MDAVKPGAVTVGRSDRFVVIRLNAPATAVVSTRLRKYLAGKRRPDVTDLYFDLSGTHIVDSTFVGMMLSMAIEQSDPAQPTVHLLRPSPGVMQTLDTMHVCHVFDCCDGSVASITEWQELPAEDVGQDSVAGLVIDAHERLIEIDERNIAPFSPVLEGFRARRRARS